MTYPSPSHPLLRELRASVVNPLRPTDAGAPTIGILICKSKSEVQVEYSLRDMNKPIGVSEYQITHALPDDLKSSLPTTEQIEAELGSHNGN